MDMSGVVKEKFVDIKEWYLAAHEYFDGGFAIDSNVDEYVINDLAGSCVGYFDRKQKQGYLHVEC